MQYLGQENFPFSLWHFPPYGFYRTCFFALFHSASSSVHISVAGRCSGALGQIDACAEVLLRGGGGRSEIFSVFEC